ncbi:MAG: hypothetical protein AAGE90_20815 [Pseudomonadota bacterium]
MTSNASTASSRTDERDLGSRSSNRFWLLQWLGSTTGRRVTVLIGRLTYTFTPGSLVAGGAVPATPLGILLLTLLWANALLSLVFGLPVGLVSLPAAAGAVWLAFCARRFYQSDDTHEVAADGLAKVNRRRTI